MEFAGDFEIHLTVQPASSARLDELRLWSKERGLKFLHIVLERGVCPSQPMLTWRGKGLLAVQKAKAEAVARELNAAGFVVSRIKIEAAPWNQDVPQTRHLAQNCAASCHFEHHIKLLLPAGTDRNALARLATEHAAHLSRNALRQREDGYEERFVTQRVFGEGRETSRPRLDSLLAALNDAGYTTLAVEEEYVVFDSNLALDAGWLTAEGSEE